ncbi:hypothetical protein PIB30_019254 [Stylosanthes scabra]|uniref:Pentatricopeptide repeat-containing protein n=1 Tax=Stylosanthes scabra TaxID=79078 RepID=A0ABU6S9J4_9FABA|nr:hypothetical protein [Stylosanthes scabra]
MKKLKTKGRSSKRDGREGEGKVDDPGKKEGESSRRRREERERHEVKDRETKKRGRDAETPPKLLCRRRALSPSRRRCWRTEKERGRTTGRGGRRVASVSLSPLPFKAKAVAVAVDLAREGEDATHGLLNEALLLFRKMLGEEKRKNSKVRPNEVTVLAVLSFCGQLSALESGRWVHSYIKNNGIQVNVQVATVLIDMYCKRGGLEDAKKVFDRITGKDVVAWNSMIMGYAIHGFYEEAFRLFDEMRGMGVLMVD